MIINEKKCILCDACRLACEKNAIIFEENASSMKIIVQNSLCEEECTKCIDICPENAIDEGKKNINQQDEFIIQYHTCDHCGMSTIPYNDNGKILCKKCKRIITAKKLLQSNGLI